MTGVGLATLGLLFVGLALGILSLVLVLRRARRSPIVAIIAAVLYFPAMLADQFGLFSSLRPPIGIARFELVQAVVAIISIGFAFWVLRGATVRTANR